MDIVEMRRKVLGRFIRDCINKVLKGNNLNKISFLIVYKNDHMPQNSEVSQK